MKELFGEYIQEFPPDLDSLEMTFTPTRKSIQKRWSNNRLSAQFAADYFSTFLPVNENDPDSDRRIKESKCAVSYVANELLENAMKFNDSGSKFKVKFGIYFIEKNLKKASEVTAVIYTTNSLKSQRVEGFKAFLKELLTSNPEELYIAQVEKSMEEEHLEASGLGFLTMINDYSAKLGWKFETLNAERKMYTVTTMAQVTI